MDLPLRYAPIRARIAVDLEDAETTTDICIVVAGLAHDNTEQILALYGPDLVADIARVYHTAIADVRRISAALDARYQAAGLTAEASAANVNAQLSWEFFQQPYGRLGETC